MQLYLGVWHYINVLIGNLSEIRWWSGPWDLGRGTLQWDGPESLLNHHSYMELLDSRRDRLNKEIEEKGTNN